LDFISYIKLKYINLKKRIKTNEGFSARPYKDQLGYYTIGYGHLIKKNESTYLKKNFTKKHFEHLFEKDFCLAVNFYKKFFCSNSFKKNERELLIEMIFQIGGPGVLKFKKMINNIKNNKKYMAALEMKKSIWYKQTPARVENLIKYFLYS
tara:strand:- start:43169 stop:43621 length:453 start_codon:yes stop_codon:yes gene_type:complete